MWQSLPSLLVKLASVYLVGFLFWRRLKSDYPSSALLWTYLLTLTGTISLPFAVKFLVMPAPLSLLPPELYFWLGGLIGFIAGTRLFPKDKINFYEVADYLWLALAGVVILTSVAQFILHLSAGIRLPQITFIGWWLFTWGFSFWLSFNFRQMMWYKSGKVGLTAMLGPAVYFAGNALLAIFLPSDLYWGGQGITPVFFYLPLSLILFVFVVRHAQINLSLLDIKTKIGQIKTHGQKTY